MVDDDDNNDDTKPVALPPVTEVTTKKRKKTLSNSPGTRPMDADMNNSNNGDDDSDDTDDDAVTSSGTPAAAAATTTVATTTRCPTDNNGKTCVFVQVSIGNIQSQKTRIAVTDGQFIDHIKKAIKVKCSNKLATVDAVDILLFTSPKAKEPIDSLEKWSTNVTWGTPENPLIVKVNHMATKSTNGMMDGNTNCLLAGKSLTLSFTHR